MIYLNRILTLNWSDLSQTFQMPRTVCVCVCVCFFYFLFFFSGSLFVESHRKRKTKEKNKKRLASFEQLGSSLTSLTCGLRHLAQICCSLTNVKKSQRLHRPTVEQGRPPWTGLERRAACSSVMMPATRGLASRS